MNIFRQVYKIARDRMADGLTGRDLKASLREVVAQLTQAEQQILQGRIAKEEYFLGKAGWDPNQFKNCREAKSKKVSSPNSKFLILTYRTPICGSCGLNRSGNCALMGGKLISGPGQTPEAAVHRTADIMALEGELTHSRSASVVNLSEKTPALRIKALHYARKKASKRVFSAKSTLMTEIRAIRLASIMDSVDPAPVRAKVLTGSSRASNAEGVQIASPNVSTDRVGAVKANRWAKMMESSSLTVRAKARAPKVKSASAEIPSAPYVDVPTREGRKANRALNEEHSDQAQSALHLISRKASQLLAEGQITTALAERIVDRMSTLENFGATHTPRTASIRRQLGALTGALEL